MQLLFICTGNTCRSPLAEVIARHVLAARGVEDVHVGSAGTNAWDGASASDGSLLVAMEHGLDLSGHRARAITRDLVDSADLLLTMSTSHLERVEALGGADKSHLLTAFAAGGSGRDGGRPVHDPFGSDLVVYRETYDELYEEITRVVDRLVDARRPR
ncbi:MAG: low molecular weight protein arginine phosphatase [Gemmatimonadaceae bacterium]|jgi:protein-tyrosine-phosphatase|nr:low molecular weight protein arginine phosphatase [Gemmatimonadaceae bacterium]